MFTNTKNLKGLVVRATDGELGKINELYFDDQSWGIRYFTVETGSWLEGKEVLISPYAVRSIDWQSKRIDVSLSKKQVQHSPDASAHKPVSRQWEAEYVRYYGYPNYWGGSQLWGTSEFPEGVAIPAGFSPGMADEFANREPVDSHLRSTEAVSGYAIEAADGEIGHVDCFIVEEKAWAIRYLEVATKNWWPGKKVLVSPSWVESVNWGESKVHVALTRSEIQNAPEYLETMNITREYENRLYFHYGRPPYWIKEAKREAAEALAASSV